MAALFSATELVGYARRKAHSHKNAATTNIIKYSSVMQRTACLPKAGRLSQSSRLSNDNGYADEQGIETPLSLAALSRASKQRQQSRTRPRPPAPPSPSSPCPPHPPTPPNPFHRTTTPTASSPPQPHQEDIDTTSSSLASNSRTNTCPPASTSKPPAPARPTTATDSHRPSTIWQVAVAPAKHTSPSPRGVSRLHPGPDSETATATGGGGGGEAAVPLSRRLGEGDEQASGGPRAAPEEQPRRQSPAVTFNTVEELRQLLRNEGPSVAHETRTEQGPGAGSGCGKGPPVAPAVSFRSAAELRQLLAKQQHHAVAAPASGGSGSASAAAAHKVPAANGGRSGVGPHSGMTSANDDDVNEGPEGCDPWDGAVSGRGSDFGQSWDVTATVAAAEGVGERGRTPVGGEEVSPEMEADSEYQKAKRYALSALQRVPLPTAELSRRLVRRGAHPQHVTALLGWLGTQGALNDGLFARLYVQSKWNSNLMAPGKIQQELLRQGVGPQHVAAALAIVFGPSRRIRLTGTATQQEKEVREALLAAARRQVERSSRGARAATRGGQDRNSVSTAAARVKEREGKRRRLAHWLSYRGHSMDLITKVFGLLGI